MPFNQIGLKIRWGEIRWQNAVREILGAKTNFRSMWQFWLEKITWCDMVSGWKGLWRRIEEEKKWRSTSKHIDCERQWRMTKAKTPTNILNCAKHSAKSEQKKKKNNMNIEHLLFVMKHLSNKKRREQETQCRYQTIKYFHFIKMKRLNADDNHSNNC